MLNYSSLMNEFENIKNCYFIYSYDLGLVHNFLKKIESKTISKDLKQFNYTTIKFDNNFDIEYFFEVCNTIPMMSDKKIIVLENASFLKRDGENKEVVSRVKEYLKNLPTYCIVIIYYIFQDQDKNKDILSSFSSFGEVCKIQELKGEEFYREVSLIFKKNNVLIKTATIRFFCDRVVNDFLHINNEIIKLKSFVGDREVTVEDIEKIISRGLEHNVFSFINNVLDKKLRDSLKSLKELISSGKEINYIFAMLTNQFLKFLDIKIMIDSGLNSKEILDKTKINQYVLNNFLKLSKRYSLKELVDIIDGFLNVEHKIKSLSNVDLNYEIENYVTLICAKK